jgi:osmoprotectant transport system substrate-binding protein
VRFSVGLVLALSSMLPACSVGVGEPASRPEAASALFDDAITVASFNFPESVLLAQLYAQALEARGFRVSREIGIGPRELVQPALQNGIVELVPEYSGSLLAFFSSGIVSADPRRDLEEALASRDLAALAAAPAQTRNGFAVTAAFAGRHGLRSISDLSGAPELTLGGPPECPQRELCQEGLEDVYGLTFDGFVPLDLSGTLTADALERGVVDVALLFTTSAEIVQHGFVLLEDDLHLQPAEHVTPVVHTATLSRFGPALSDAVDDVSAALTTKELRTLNTRVQVQGVSPAAAAAEWLAEHGLAEPGG